MNPIRQERKSCEACRTRKLRCSGEKNGCSRCRGLSLTCKFKDKGAPGRPRKRTRQDERDGNLPNADLQTVISGSSFPSVVPRVNLDPQSAVNMFMAAGELDSSPCELTGGCGFDAFQWEVLESGGLSALPVESWQPSHQNELHNPEIPQVTSDVFASPTSSFSQSCKCDEEVTSTVRSLNGAKMSNEIVQSLRSGISLAEQLLSCPVCYDVSKPPRLTVQNVLLIGHLLFEVTSGYQKYLQWLNEYCANLDIRNESETVHLNPGIGTPMGLSIRVRGEKFRELVMHGLQTDAERLSVLGKNFAQRQRNRHMVGHEACPGPEGHCRKKEDGFDHDPLDICPQNSVARKLIPCFRIVDEVREMIKPVSEAVG